jgi:hypothetical protein
MTDRGSKGRERMQRFPEIIEREGLDVILEVGPRLGIVAFAKDADLGRSHAEGPSTMPEVGPSHFDTTPPLGVLLVQSFDSLNSEHHA